MSVYLENARYLLSQVKNTDEKIKQAKNVLNSVSKQSGLFDFVHNPKFQNIINLLTPFVVNYKVNQVLKLLKELERENKWWS